VEIIWTVPYINLSVVVNRSISITSFEESNNNECHIFFIITTTFFRRLMSIRPPSGNLTNSCKEVYFRKSFVSLGHCNRYGDFHCLIWNIIPQPAWKEWRKPWNFLTIIPGLRVAIQTWRLLRDKIKIVATQPLSSLITVRKLFLQLVYLLIKILIIFFSQIFLADISVHF
jgi:hypothetical protein